MGWRVVRPASPCPVMSPLRAAQLGPQNPMPAYDQSAPRPALPSEKRRRWVLHRLGCAAVLTPCYRFCPPKSCASRLAELRRCATRYTPTPHNPLKLRKMRALAPHRGPRSTGLRTGARDLHFTNPNEESEEAMSPTEKIAHLNDKARKGLLPGSTKMLLTRMVAALPDPTLCALTKRGRAVRRLHRGQRPLRGAGLRFDRARGRAVLLEDRLLRSVATLRSRRPLRHHRDRAGADPHACKRVLRCLLP